MSNYTFLKISEFKSARSKFKEWSLYVFEISFLKIRRRNALRNSTWFSHEKQTGARCLSITPHAALEFASGV